jgi:hypothetical protein
MAKPRIVQKAIGIQSTIGWHRFEALRRQRTVESERSQPPRPAGIVRPNFLTYNPTHKSGYLFLSEEKIHSKYNLNPLSEWKKNIPSTIKAIEIWHGLLKRHPNYQSVYVEPTANVADVMDALHNETDRLFKGFDWVFHIPSYAKQEPQIVYFKYENGVHNCIMPLSVFDESKDPRFRKAGLSLMKALADRFGIPYIESDSFDSYALEGIEIDEEYVRNKLEDRYGDDTEPDFETHLNNLLSYKDGPPKRLRKEMEPMKFDPKEFKCEIKYLQHTPIGKWMMEGLKILELPKFCVGSFDLNPWDLEHNDGDMVPQTEMLWFPYSIDDHAFADYKEYIDCMANGFGWGETFSYGTLSKKKHVKPVDFGPMMILMQYIIKGMNLFKVDDRIR